MKYLTKAGFYFCMVVVLIMNACQPKKPESNPYYEPVFKKLDSLNMTEDLLFLDTVKNVLFKREPPGEEDWVVYYRRRASVLREANPFKSITVLDSMENFLKAHPHLSRFNHFYGEMFIARVEAYTATRQYDKALKVMTDAKQFIDENLHEPRLNSELIHALADMLYQQQRFRLAASYYLDLYKNAQLIDTGYFDRYYQSYSGLSNAGICYNESQMYDSAQICFNKAFKVIDEYEPPATRGKTYYYNLSRGVVSGNLGETKLALKEYKEAEALLTFAIQATQAEYPSYAQGSLFDLAKVYLESRQLEKAKQILDTLDNVKDKPASDYKFAYNLNKSKKEYYQKKADYVIALHYGTIAEALRDSMDVIQKKDVDRDFAMEFAANEQKKINDNLKTQNERTRFQLLMAVLLVVIALLAIALIWSNLRRASTYSRNLKNLNEEIQLKNRDILDAYASLEESYLVNKTLMRTVAHDLKNPIGGIRGLARWLTKKMEGLKDAQETLALIDTACSNSINLIDDMVKSDSLKLHKINKELNDMLRLLEYCVELMKPRAEEKQQQLLLEGQRADVFINKDKMWRVITNILNNAIKFSPKNGVIKVTLEKRDDSILLSVHDNGIGIPDDLKDKIFESTPEVQRLGTMGEESFGLGLNISKKIVEEHNGKLWVESEAGKGSTFFLMLPAAPLGDS